MPILRSTSPHILVIALLIAFCGCDGDNGNGPDPEVKTFPENAEDYFPMEQGDVWYYTEQGETTVIRRIGDRIEFRDDTCTAVLTSLPPIFADSLDECWTIDATGFYIHLLAFKYHPDPLLSIPFNLRSDKPHHFESFLAVNGDPGNGFTISGDLHYQGLATKTVPAGTFQNCVKLYYDDGIDPYHEYYAPDVGLLDNGSLILDSAIVGSVSYGM
jgi:hypothetical protein